MREIVRAAIKNSPAMNMIMIATLVVGMMSLLMMRREVFPEFELEIVLVSVPYPMATPEDVERGICQKIEEAVHSVDGIKKMTSVAAEGAGSVVLELRADVRDVQKVVNEVRSAVDTISRQLPENAEKAEVQQITFREPVIKVGVLVPEDASKVDEFELRGVAERIREELLELETVSQVELSAVRDYQIDVEIPENRLRSYGLTLQDVANVVRRENVDLPGGTMKTTGQEILLRGNNKRYWAQEIAGLPLITDPNGVVLTIGDVGQVRDGFSDKTAINEVDGRPGLVLTVNRTKTEDILKITQEVRDYVEQVDLPGGYTLTHWGDRSIDVEDRLNMLIENGIMGLVLVFLVLAVFLELKLAFWVALGIPVALLGAGGAMILGGQTLNMLSMFSFLMALGIVVDDAIVVGENIYSHRQSGKKFVRAAVDGTLEVMPSVMASVTTTIIAFSPLFFVSGVMGKFIAVMPFAVIAMLVISLLESMFVLPTHLAHDDSLIFRLFRFFFYPLSFVVRFFARVNAWATMWLARFIDGPYSAALTWAVRNPWSTISGAFAIFLITVGMVIAGLVPFNIFPKLDSNYIIGNVTFPDGTPTQVADDATRRMADALREVCQEFGDGTTLLTKLHRNVGSLTGGDPLRGDGASGGHVGSIDAELVDTTLRSVKSDEIIAAWRKKVGPIPGTDSLRYGTPNFGPGGKPVEFKLLANNGYESYLEPAIEDCKEKLTNYAGVFDIEDDSRPGKIEFQIDVKDDAKSLGISTQQLIDTVRSAYYGAEVMRLQRGRHEVKLMVRYPKSERSNFASFDDIRIRTGDGEERPITEIAEIQTVRGFSEINRLDQKRSVTISADLDETVGNARNIVADLKKTFEPELLAKYPGISVRWEGQQEQTQESLSSLGLATVVALFVMFVLLTLEFRSYLQPLIIMMIIPFGVIGAILGHWAMGLPLTLFSFFGLVALTGVVVNDSIVLVDFINHRVRAGLPIEEAVIDAGKRRFRPVLLTSATTVAGLAPILMESSFQAQILIPMATSLGFGLLLATILVLLLVPTLYKIYRQLLPVTDDELDDDAAPILTSEATLESAATT